MPQFCFVVILHLLFDILFFFSTSLWGSLPSYGLCLAFSVQSDVVLLSAMLFTSFCVDVMLHIQCFVPCTPTPFIYKLEMLNTVVVFLLA